MILTSWKCNNIILPGEDAINIEKHFNYSDVFPYSLQNDSSKVSISIDFTKNKIVNKDLELFENGIRTIINSMSEDNSNNINYKTLNSSSSSSSSSSLSLSSSSSSSPSLVQISSSSLSLSNSSSSSSAS